MASYSKLNWALDRAMDEKGNVLLTEGVRLYLEPETQEGEKVDEDEPFADGGQVIGAEVFPAWPGIIKFRRKNKGNIAVEIRKFEPSLVAEVRRCRLTSG